MTSVQASGCEESRDAAARASRLEVWAEEVPPDDGKRTEEE